MSRWHALPTRGLDSAFAGGSRTVAQVFDDVRAVFEKWEERAPGFTYYRKQDYWHTEGNFDFLGILSSERRAAWRIQFFTRAFAAGIRKVAVMDASAAEQTTVRAYVATLPNPFPILPASNEIVVVAGNVSVFRHPDGLEPTSGQVWIIWALADSGPATVSVPVQRERVRIVSVNGQSTEIGAGDGRVRIELKGDSKMAAPVLVVDRPIKPGG